MPEPQKPDRGTSGSTGRSVARVLSILSLALGVVQCIRWARHGVVNSGLLVSFLPLAGFGVLYVVLRGVRPRAWIQVVAWTWAAVALTAWLLLVVPCELLLRVHGDVTSVRRYEYVLDEHWQADELVNHFPRPIPPEASNVSFFFQPVLMQRGASIQLRMTLPPDTARKQYERFAGLRTKSFFGGDINDHMNAEEGMPTTFFFTSDTGERKFPKDYEVMIFDEVLKERPDGFYWNHGQSRGVAISKLRNEIVYWAARW